MNLRNFAWNLILLIVYIFLSLTPGSIWAGTYYVSPNGTAPWSGPGNCTNIATPCKASTALNNAVAGDIVYFRGGNYYPHLDQSATGGASPNTRWNPSNSGSSGNPITFKAYPDETPAIYDNAADNQNIPFGAYERNYIVWDGFTAYRASGGAWAKILFIYHTSIGSVIRNCTLIGDTIPSSNSNYPLIRGAASNNLLIENNVLNGGSGGTTGNWSGVQFYSTNNSIIQYNTIFNNYYGIFDKNSGYNNTWRYNFVYDCVAGFHRSEFGDVSQSDYVYQNVFLNLTGEGVRAGTDAGSPTTIAFYNNTFYNAVVASECGLSSVNTNITGNIYNNIVVGYSCGARYVEGEQTNVVSEYNSFYNISSGYREGYTSYNLTNFKSRGWEANSVEVAPGFVNAGGRSPYDYRLNPQSANRNSGRGGITRGAFITGNEQIGHLSPGQQTHPAPPSSLRISTQ